MTRPAPVAWRCPRCGHVTTQPAHVDVVWHAGCPGTGRTTEMRRVTGEEEKRCVKGAA